MSARPKEGEPTLTGSGAVQLLLVAAVPAAWLRNVSEPFPLPPPHKRSTERWLLL